MRFNFTYHLQTKTGLALAQDDVACSSDEEENVKTITNMFLKAARPKDQSNKTTTLKRVGPGQRQGQSGKRRRTAEDQPDLGHDREQHEDNVDLDYIHDPVLDAACEATHLAEHGSCVVQQRVTSTAPGSDSAPDASSHAASSAPQPAQQHRVAKVCAEFQVFDGSGVLQIRQASDGRVYLPDRNAPIGRITEFKIDQPGHSVSMACSLHSTCRKIVTLKRLPLSFQADALRWLQAGTEISGRHNAAEHLKLFDQMVMRSSL